MKAFPEPASVTERLARLIDGSGPISVAHYMAEANAYYYATRDPLGAAGDFTTAPEISQMFGELIGLWLGDMWMRAGQPSPAHYVELGPGRGTLAADALRAMRALGLAPPVELVETSPVLRDAQAQRLPAAAWHDDASTLPDQGPLLIVANEFFDALPIRQLVATKSGWRELMVDCRAGRFERVAGPAVPAPLEAAEPGTIVEGAPAAAAVIRHLAQRLATQGGAALIIDYGHARSGTGDTLQAVSRHGYANPWEEPGERDLTAHVDFEALGNAAREEGVRIFGPRSQGEWLEAMGINLRTDSLAKAAPERSEEIIGARERLVSPEQMGSLFKVMALVSNIWPEPEGF
jgi:NADH dehydrogenase [ubiquinone] 1 alpha subcomplex assembly factor 7